MKAFLLNKPDTAAIAKAAKEKFAEQWAQETAAIFNHEINIHSWESWQNRQRRVLGYYNPDTAEMKQTSLGYEILNTKDMFKAEVKDGQVVITMPGKLTLTESVRASLDGLFQNITQRTGVTL